MRWSNLLRMSGMMVPFLLTLGLGTANQAAAQTASCTVTVTERNPGEGAAFVVTSGTGSVTVDVVDGPPAPAGGLVTLAVVGTPVNANVSIAVFTPGTLLPVIVTYSAINPALAVDFSVQANTSFHQITIRVQCAAPPPPPPPVLGCTLTQGFWKNHAEDWVGVSVTLGTRLYTQAQLLAIFTTPVKGNGLISLAHQLIAAKLNIAVGGASVPASVATAILAADALIGARFVPPIGTGFLDPSVTSALTTILDNYNNGNIPGGPPHCD